MEIINELFRATLNIQRRKTRLKEGRKPNISTSSSFLYNKLCDALLCPVNCLFKYTKIAARVVRFLKMLLIKYRVTPLLLPLQV